MFAELSFEGGGVVFEEGLKFIVFQKMGIGQLEGEGNCAEIGLWCLLCFDWEKESAI